MKLGEKILFLLTFDRFFEILKSNKDLLLFCFLIGNGYNPAAIGTNYPQYDSTTKSIVFNGASTCLTFSGYTDSPTTESVFIVMSFAAINSQMDILSGRVVAVKKYYNMHKTMLLNLIFFFF